MSILPEEAINKIIMYSIPKYPFLEELREVSKDTEHRSDLITLFILLKNHNDKNSRYYQRNTEKLLERCSQLEFGAEIIFHKFLNMCHQQADEEDWTDGESEEDGESDGSIIEIYDNSQSLLWALHNS